MERYNSTMRAARHVISAGTFAAAMLAMTAASASAQDCEGSEAAGAFCGHVFTDATGGTSDTYDAGEGVGGVTVVMIYADGPLAGTNVGPSPTESDSTCPGPACGYYSFEWFTPGNYSICVVIDGESTDCRPVSLGSTAVVEDFEVGDGDVEPDPNDVWGVGTGTPGYWKNHPEEWPDAGITIGGVTYVNDRNVHPNIWDAIAKMGKVSGDKTYSMFAALISAMLNTTLANNTACITPTIALADAWLTLHPVGATPVVKASSTDWQTAAGELHQKLDDYNNGKLCAPHRG